MDKAPASNSKLSLKVTHGTEIRRVSVERTSFNFELLTSTLRRLFKTLSDEEFSNLSIKYQDDESDWISVSSNDELREAIALLRTDVLRLSLVPQKQQPSHPHRGCRRWHALRQQHQQHQQQAQQCHNNSWQPRCFGGGRGRFYMLQAHALRLLESGDKNGNKSDIEAARALFHEQLSIFPDHPTPLYNIACSEALLGNSEKALEFLQKSVLAGYSNVSHMESDSDLRSLRHLEGYKAIVASLKPHSPLPKEQAKVPVPDPKPVPVPSAPVPAPEKVKVPVQVPQAQVLPAPLHVPAHVPAPFPASAPQESQEDRAMQILEGMGFVNRQRNQEALSQARGDPVLAVQLLLDADLAQTF